MAKKIKIKETQKQIVTPRSLMQAIARDNATWSDINHYPDSITCRRMVALGDAIADPKPTAKWWTWKAAFYHPDWSMRQIAGYLGIDDKTVKNNLLEIRLNGDCELPDTTDDFWNEIFEDLTTATN